MTAPKRAWTWRHAIINSNLDPTTRHVLLTLSCFMNEVGGSCFPSQSTLAEKTGLSERSVRAHLRLAVAAGWIDRNRHGFGGSKWRRHEYRAAWPESEKGNALGVSHYGAELAAARSEEGSELRSVDPAALDSAYQSKIQNSRNLTPLAPFAGVAPDSAGAGQFESLKKTYPFRRLGNLKNALLAFLALSPGDRTGALKATPVAAKHYLRRKCGRIPALATFLRRRLFAEFLDCPPIDDEGRFIITPSRQEWGPWIAKLKAQYGEALVARNILNLGIWKPHERWPPGHSETLRNTQSRARTREG